jgi:hypothetical protein
MSAFKLKDKHLNPDTSPAPTGSPRKKKLLILAALLVCLPLFLYFFLTSSLFIKSFVLPKAGQALNATISVDDVSVSPFSAVSLRGLKVTTTGEPLLTADSASVRFSLMDIIGGKLNVSELKVQSPTVNIVQNADGSSNLDPILKALQASEPAKEPETADAGKKPQLALKNISLENARFTLSQALPEGGSQTVDLASINLNIDQVVSGIAGKLQLGTDIVFNQQLTKGSPVNRLEAKATAGFEFLITPELQPQTIKGKAELKVGKVAGTFADLAGFVATLDSELSLTDVKSLRLTFSQNAESLGAISMSGPMDLDKGEAKLSISIEPLGKRVLNLAGAAIGYDFGSTLLSGENTIAISQGFTLISVIGQFEGKQFTLIKDQQQIAPLDFSANYSLQHDRATTNTVIDKLSFTSTQKGKPLLDVSISQPIKLSPSGDVSGNSFLTMKLSQLNLADWKPIVGEAASGGLVDASVDVSFQNGGKDIQTTYQTTIKQLALISGTNAPSPIDAALKGKLAVKNFQSVKGDAVLNVTGKFGEIKLNNLQVAADLSVNVSTQQVISPNLTASLQHDGKPAGSFDFSGTYTPTNATGKFDYSLANLNENLLTAVMAPFLTDATLTSLTINSKGSITLNPTAESAVKADLQISRLLVTDKAGKLPKETLTAVALLDAGMDRQVLNLRNVELRLTPTDRAKNELSVTGKIDSSKADAITGNVKISSAGLDLTRYYDLFAGTTSDSGTPSAASPASASDPTKEPDAIKLPFKDFKAELDIKKLYLREIAAENWLTTLLLNGSQVKIDPAQLTLNGAPVSARVDLDLSVPGYRYDISAKADKVPLAPLANSFAPDYKNRAAGDLFANIGIKGAGTTDKSLQQNLTGNISLNFTNANIQLVEKGKFYPVISAIALVLRIPELLQTPLNAVYTDITIGQGTIDLQKAAAHSPAFIASLAGPIKMADVLTNSPLSHPVEIQLAKGLAKHFSLTDRDTSAAFVAMPSFVTLKGTLGEPKADIKELVITGLLLKSAGALPLDLGDKGNNILKGVGNILTGQSKDKSTTNAPSSTTTNKTTINPFDLFKKKK